MTWTARDIESDYYEPQTIADAFNEIVELKAKNKEQAELIGELVQEGTVIRNKLKRCMDKGCPSTNADFIIHCLSSIDKLHEIAKQLQEADNDNNE